jgi:hypothetical protein
VVVEVVEVVVMKVVAVVVVVVVNGDGKTTRKAYPTLNC